MDSEDRDISPGHWKFDKDEKTHNSEKTASLTNGVGETGYLHAEEKTSLSTCTQINYKYIKKFSVRTETLILLEGRVGSTVQDIGSGKGFLNRLWSPRK